MAKKNKYQIWQDKRKRTKYHIMKKNVANLPRLVVYRSNSNIYAQLIDDGNNKTILAASSIDIPNPSISPSDAWRLLRM